MLAIQKTNKQTNKLTNKNLLKLDFMVVYLTLEQRRTNLFLITLISLITKKALTISM